MDVNDIIEKAVPIFKKYPGLKHVELFGSYSKGTYTKDSDIDFLIDANEKVFTLRQMLKMNVELESIFGKKVDIVYRSDIQSPTFVKSILESPYNINIYDDFN